MASTNHVRGATNAIPLKALATGVTLNAGDFVLQDGSGNPYPAASEAWVTDLATTQANAKGKFVGVALEDCPAGRQPLVATDGEFRYPIASGTPNVGGLVGIAKAAGNALLSNQVATAVLASSIGRVVEQVGTTVVVRINSQIVNRV